MLLDITNVQSVNGVGYWLSAWQFGPVVATAWRTGPDIGWPGNVSWADVLRNLDDDALHPSAQSSGHYNRPRLSSPRRHQNPIRVRRASLDVGGARRALHGQRRPAAHAQDVALADHQPGGDRNDRTRQTPRTREVGTSGIWIKPMTVGVAVGVSEPLKQKPCDDGLRRFDRTGPQPHHPRRLGNTPGDQLPATFARSSRHEAQPCSGSTRGRTSTERREGAWSKSGPLHGQAQSGALPDIRRLTKLDQ